MLYAKHQNSSFDVAFICNVIMKLKEVLTVSWYSYLHRLVHNMGRAKNILL